MIRSLLLVALTIVVNRLEAANTTSRSFSIGGILHTNHTQEHFINALRKINFDGESVADETTLYDVSVMLRGSPITTALQVCDSLITKGVYAVVVASPRGGILTTVAVSYISSFYHIPVICTYSRDSAFSDKNIHVFFLRTVPPFSHQADVWVALLKHFHYRRVIFIHTSDTNGRALHSRFQTLAQHSQEDEGIKLASVIEFNPGEESFVEELNSIKAQLVKVILLYADEEDAETIFHDANYLNMTGPGYMWLVTEQAINARYVPVGALGFQLKYAHDIDAHITDSLRVAALGLRQLHEQEKHIPEPPMSCDDKEGWEETGKTLLKLMRQQVLYDGETGKVGFDSRGDRIFAEYSLMNVQNHTNHLYGVNTLATVGEFSYDKGSDEMKLSVNMSDILWPGGTTDIPLGYTLPTHFRAVTLREKPFVYAEPVASPDECGTKNEILCPLFNTSSNESELMCCWGYCIDLLLTLSRKNNFTFSLELSPDDHYGDFKEKAQGKKEWTGVIGQLVNEEQGVDMVIAPLTINPERSDAIAFSKPFKYQGITILVKRVPHEATLVSILQPFRDTLWFMLLATVHVIAVLVWLLDRMSPVYKMTGEETDSLAITESFWFSWGVILNSGLTEGTPRCISGRVLGIVWGGFAMIMVASYTANLAAFLVLESPVTTITGINDARLRNPVENYTFATIRGSSVDMFFRRKTEWSNMYRVMEMHNYDTVEEALQALRDGTLQAFIWESSRLEFEASQDCNLVTVGELFGRSGYGLGLKKGSPWAEKITIDILDLHERGYMEDLDKIWIWNNDITCPEELLDHNFSKRLGLKNLEGIFVMIAGGILSGILLILAEIAYDRCKEKKKKTQVNTIQERIEDDDIGGGVATAGRDSQGEVMKLSVINHILSGKAKSDKENRSDPTLEERNEATNQRSEILNTEKELRLKFLDPNHPCSKIVLQDIEDRLKRSPNIPEEWKSRSPLEWFQYYLDILHQDTEGADGAEDTRKAVAIMEGFAEFISETGIKDFSELYDDDNDYDDNEEEEEEEEGYNDNCNAVGENACADLEIENEDCCEGCQRNGHNSANKDAINTSDDNERNPVPDSFQFPSVSFVQRKLFKQQADRLPDVLGNCSDREASSNEEESIIDVHEDAEFGLR